MKSVALLPILIVLLMVNNAHRVDTQESSAVQEAPTQGEKEQSEEDLTYEMTPEAAQWQIQLREQENRLLEENRKRKEAKEEKNE